MPVALRNVFASELILSVVFTLSPAPNTALLRLKWKIDFHATQKITPLRFEAPLYACPCRVNSDNSSLSLGSLGSAATDDLLKIQQERERRSYSKSSNRVVNYSKSSNREKDELLKIQQEREREGVTQNPVTEEDELLKIQQEREREELFKIQQERERERSYSKSSNLKGKARRGGEEYER